MRRFTVGILSAAGLLVFLLSRAAAAGPLDTLQPGHWYEISNSHLEDVLPPYDAGGSAGSIMAAWSGGAYDTWRNRLLVWGGGHNDYGGNEVYAFEVGGSLTWSIIWGPSPDIPPRYSGCAETYSDGNPSSRHTYEGLEYIPTTDELWSQGGSRWCSSGDNTRASWTLDLANPSWDRKNDAADAKAGTTSAYDPVTGHVFRRGLSHFEEYNPATGSFTVRENSGSDNDGMTAAIDPERRYYVEIGRPSWSTQGAIHAWNLQTGARMRDPDFPSSAFNCRCIDGPAPGFDYDPVSKRLVAWCGGTAVYSLDVSNWTWSQHDPAPSNSVSPSSPTPNGTFGRFRYVPSKNLFVVVTHIAENVFAYKLSPGAGVADTTAPAVPTDLRAR